MYYLHTQHAHLQQSRELILVGLEIPHLLLKRRHVAFGQRNALGRHCSRRLTITLPQSIYHQLVERSDWEGRSMSNLAAYLLETSLDEG